MVDLYLDFLIFGHKYCSKFSIHVLYELTLQKKLLNLNNCFRQKGKPQQQQNKKTNINILDKA